jgi:hypothetical protein
VRWISTVVLQANLRGTDRVGEGANDSEGALTIGRRHERLREVRTPGRGARTLGRGART